MPCLDTQAVLHYLTDEPEPHTHTLPHPHTHTISHIEKQQVGVLSICLFLELKNPSKVKGFGILLIPSLPSDLWNKSIKQLLLSVLPGNRQDESDWEEEHTLSSKKNVLVLIISVRIFPHSLQHLIIHYSITTISKNGPPK